MCSVLWKFTSEGIPFPNYYLNHAQYYSTINTTKLLRLFLDLLRLSSTVLDPMIIETHHVCSTLLLVVVSVLWGSWWPSCHPSWPSLNDEVPKLGSKMVPKLAQGYFKAFKGFQRPLQAFKALKRPLKGFTRTFTEPLKAFDTAWKGLVKGT